MAQHIAPIWRQRVCGPVPTTDPTDAALRLRRAELRIEALAAALRALADTTDGAPAHRQQQAIDAEAMLDGAGL